MIARPKVEQLEGRPLTEADKVTLREILPRVSYSVDKAGDRVSAFFGVAAGYAAASGCDWQEVYEYVAEFI